VNRAYVRDSAPATRGRRPGRAHSCFMLRAAGLRQGAAREPLSADDRKRRGALGI